MRLFKYYSYGGGDAAIDSQNYGFREPRHFNDPFELTYLLDPANSHASTQAARLIEELRTRICVLSLTRSGLNPLMWAHYAESHKGFVLEYDVDDEFLTSPKYNLVPVQSGKVTYKSKNSSLCYSEDDYARLHTVFLQACGSPEGILQSHCKIIEFLYLTKDLVWQYEDEVRVVKLVDSIFEETHHFLCDPLRSYKVLTKPLENCSWCEVETQPGLKLFDMHQAKIKSIYLGVNNPLSKDRELLEQKLSKWRSQGVDEVFQVQPHLSSWSLHPKPLNF